MTLRPRTYVTVTCTSCDRRVMRAPGNPYFVSRAVAERALQAHALEKHAKIATEKVAVKKTTSYEVVR